MQEMQETQVRFLDQDDWSLWVGNGNPLQYTCLKNPMDRGLQSMGLQSQTQLSNWEHMDDIN